LAVVKFQGEGAEPDWEIGRFGVAPNWLAIGGPVGGLERRTTRGLARPRVSRRVVPLWGAREWSLISKSSDFPPTAPRTRSIHRLRVCPARWCRSRPHRRRLDRHPARALHEEKFQGDEFIRAEGIEFGAQAEEAVAQPAL
jgi:hypothetical protein